MTLLHPSAGGVRQYFGMPGSGKSWLARHDALASGRRIVALDNAGKDDWCNLRTKYRPPSVQAWMRANKKRTMAVVRDFKHYEEQWDKGTTLIVVQHCSEEEKAKILEHAINQEQIAIVIHELHTLGHTGMESVILVATLWRHREAAVFLDTQRPVRLPPHAREIATQTHVFMLAGALDRDACVRLANTDDAPGCTEADFVRAHRQVCALHKSGVRGAHVALDETRTGPYTVRQVRAGAV